MTKQIIGLKACTTIVVNATLKLQKFPKKKDIKKKGKKMNLYELTEAYQNLLDLDLEEEELQGHLKNIDDEIEIKAENIAKVLRSLDAEAEAYKKEIERFTLKKQGAENRAKRLKTYLQEAMEAVDKKKFKTDLFSFNIQKNAPSLKILDESKIPEDFYKIERKLNKVEFKKAVKEGLYEEAAELVQSESLRIR